MNNVYSIKNLSYRVANNKIISDISCDINNACISVIKGPNGAGKTTLLKLIFGFLQPSSGMIIRNYDQNNMEISYVFQNPIFLNRTVRENLCHALYCKDIHKSKWNSIIEKKADEFSLHDFLDIDIGLLSGGELQLISLLRSSLIMPNILFYDEPTNNLDSQNIKLISKILNRYQKEGSTIIMVSHDDLLLRNLNHQELIMEKGRLLNV